MYREALKEIREAVFARADQDLSQTPTAVTRVDYFINAVLQQLALDCPFFFHEQQTRLSTDLDVEPADPTDTISVAAYDDLGTGTGAVARSPWVMQQDLLISSSPLATAMRTDRSWDGRTIEIQDLLGVWHTNQIRSVWQQDDIDVPGERRNFIALAHPWASEAADPNNFNRAWRILTDKYLLPDNMIELKSMRIIGDQFPENIEILSQDDAERYGLTDNRYLASSGVPRWAFRRGHVQITPPNQPPDVATGAPPGSPSVNWVGPEPFGEFDYCLTYTWGKRGGPQVAIIGDGASYQAQGVGTWDQTSISYVNSDITAGTNEEWAKNRIREPLIESSPSPISAKITVASNAEVQPAIRLTLPNIEYVQEFLSAGLTNTSTPFLRHNSGRSGWHVRIWRRRHTQDFVNYTTLGTSLPGQSVSSLHKLDLHDGFQLLAEMPITHLNEGYFYDDGSIIPDYHRRLRNVHGYHAFQLYPRPDARYEIEVRAIMRPPRLVSDSDVPQIHPEAIELVVEGALAMFYQMQSEVGMAAAMSAQYESRLVRLRNRYGNMQPGSAVSGRRPARAKGYSHRATHRWWKGGS